MGDQLMPELPIMAAQAMAPAATPLAQAKQATESISSVIDSVNKFANSEVGKHLLGRILPPQGDGVKGFAAPAQGDHKPMPADSRAPITSPFYNGGEVGPAGHRAIPEPQVVIREVVKEVPARSTPSELYDASLNGIMQLADQIGQEKTLGEAIEWIRTNKSMLILHFSMQAKK